MVDLQRKSANKSRYLIALVITLLVFFLGVSLTLLVTNYRADVLTNTNRLQKLDYDSLQLQYLYLDALKDSKNCKAANKALEENINNLDKTRIRLEGYIEGTYNGKDEDLSLLKREYSLAQIRYLLLARQTEKVCPRDSISVLYFYSNNKCDDCGAQGTILTYLKSQFEDKLLIFSFDADFDKEPLVPIIKEAFNVTLTPTLIIDDQKFEGLQRKEKILSRICPTYEEKPDLCRE